MSIVCWSQGPCKQLLEAASNYGLFVNKLPIAKLPLDTSNVNEYLENLHESNSKIAIPKNILVEIIQNARNVDTSYWKDSEWKRQILVSENRFKVDLNYIKQKFVGLNKKQLRFYRKRLRKFKNGNYYVNSYSRPVFDNSHKYAIVQYDYPPSGFIVPIFFFDNNCWQTVGVIKRVSY